MQFASTRTRRAASAQPHLLRWPLLTVALVALLSGCGAPRLQPEVPTGVSLAGPWRLDRQASEDPDVLIAQLQQKLMKRMPRMHEERDSPPGAGAPPAGPTGARPVTGTSVGGGFRDSRYSPANIFRNRYTQALGARLDNDGLFIEQTADRFVIVRGDSRRSYTPGGHSVVSVADGVADQSAGWKGREFVIDVRAQVGPRLTERYGLDADGRLIEKITVAEDGLPKLEFTRTYSPGAAPARSLPTSN